MNNLIDMDMINSSDFDYTQLDVKTSNELQSIATRISATASNLKYFIGEQLNKAQELLAKNRYGCFGEWIESYGLKKQTAYNCINYYKVFVQNLDNRKTLEQLPASKIYELGKLETEQQKLILENANLEDMTIKEVKDLTRQLKEEQEYSEELQNAIKQKEQEIQQLQKQIKSIQVPEKEIIEKEVIKEVVPDEVIEEKKRLQNEKQILQQEIECFRKRAEKAEYTIRSIKLEDNIEKDRVFDTAKLDMLLYNIKDFLDKNSKFTYLKEDLQNIPSSKKRFVQQGVNSIKEWTILMEQALDNRQDAVGNIIYGEGEVINE